MGQRSRQDAARRADRCGLPISGVLDGSHLTKVLARCLGERGATAEALRLYERLRSDRAAMVFRRSRRVGAVGQLKNPVLCWLRDQALAVIPPKAQLRQLEEVLGYEA